MEKIYPYLDILFLVLILIFLIIFLIRLIGKKRGIQRKEKFETPINTIGENKQLKTLSNSKENNNNNINSYAEGSLNYKISKINQFDENFEYRSFLNYCKEAFKAIVISFNQGNLEEAKKYLSINMFNLYQSYIDSNQVNNSIVIDSFIIVDISHVSFIEKIVDINVKFVTKQTINNKTIENREVWVFTKDTNNKDSNWVVTKIIND